MTQEVGRDKFEEAPRNHLRYCFFIYRIFKRFRFWFMGYTKFSFFLWTN